MHLCIKSPSAHQKVIVVDLLVFIFDFLQKKTWLLEGYIS